jgi:hypothetical protein
MAAEWLAVARGITGISDKIFGNLRKFGKLKSEERKRLADLLDLIAKEVQQISKEMSKREIPTTICQRINEYSIQLPFLVERAYDKERAERLRDELCMVYDSRRIARAILSHPKLQATDKAQIKALKSTVDAAAGTIKATANILRAM